MANYNAIRGRLVQSLTSDPSITTAYEGQVWYNSTESKLKSLVQISAWSSTTPLPIVGHQWGGAGIQTANVIFGGTSPAANAENKTYEFNGSGWSTEGNLNTARTAISGAGTQTAALGAGGYLFPGGASQAETYDGSSWTNITSMPTAQSYSSTGTQTTALYVSNPGAVLEYSSPSWTSGGALGTPRAEGSTSGTQTSGLFFGGGPQTSASSGTEEYDGSAWTAGNNMNTARGIQIGGSGSQTASLAFGGAGPNEPAVSTATEDYDGTSWTTVGSLSTARSRTAKGGAQGTTTANIAQGGTTPPRTDSVELYNVSLNAITAAAWASGGTMNTARRSLAGSGTQTAALAFGGNQGPAATAVNNSEEYDGSSWTEGNNLNTTRYAIGSAGTQTATLASGGANPGGSPQDAVESYDGSSWTSGTSLPTATQAPMSYCGIQTAALVAGGFAPSYTSASYEWDGSSWTSGGALNNAVGQHSGLGIQTAALSIGGERPGALTNQTEEYNGSSWTVAGSLPSARQGQGTSGTQTAGLAFGGQLPSSTAENLGYDGTSWSTRPSLATARGALAGGGAGTDALAIAFGGNVPPHTGATEEFTGETSAITASTITTS